MADNHSNSEIVRKFGAETNSDLHALSAGSAEYLANSLTKDDWTRASNLYSRSSASVDNGFYITDDGAASGGEKFTVHNAMDGITDYAHRTPATSILNEFKHPLAEDSRVGVVATHLGTLGLLALKGYWPGAIAIGGFVAADMAWKYFHTRYDINTAQQLKQTNGEVSVVVK